MNLNVTLCPVEADGRLTSELAILLDLFKIDIHQPLEDLDKELWERWVLGGKRRHDPEKILSSRYKRAIFWRSVRGLGFYTELTADQVAFDHVLIRGGPPKPQDRTNELLARLWRQGVEFGTLTHMGSDKRLDNALESARLLHSPQPGGLEVDPCWQGIRRTIVIEADASVELWQRSLFPAEMRRIPTWFTGNDYAEWLKADPRRGRHVLIAAANPQAPSEYWDAVHAFRGTGFDVHVIASSAALGPQRVGYFTGAIARWIRSYYRVASTR